MKAVIHSITSELEIIDICHEIPSYSILPACFTLDKSYGFFPEGSIFLVVVDPGVGSKRNILLIECENRYFIGPDNGVLTPILIKKNKRVWTLDNPKYFLIDGNSTFEARDKMSPVIAHLANGTLPDQLASRVFQFTIEMDYLPYFYENRLKAKILYIDKFGNIMTGITTEILNKTLSETSLKNFKIILDNYEISQFFHSYNEAGMNQYEKPFILAGSHGNLEIAMNMKSAASELNTSIGKSVVLELY